MNFSDVLKRIRRDNKLTQAELSELLNVTAGHIGMLEQGRAKPSYEVMERIVDLYSVDANLFFNEAQQDVRALNEITIKSLQSALIEVQERLNLYGHVLDKAADESSDDERNV